MTNFRAWLLNELRIRQWTQSDLADRLGVNRSAVAKWVATPGTSSFRQPSYESCRSLAEVFGIPQEIVLTEAGLAPASVEATPLQQQVMALIPHIPDAMLQVIYHQLIPMADTYVQQQVLPALSEPSGRTRPVTSIRSSRVAS